MKFEFESDSENENIHNCECSREGDWLVFTCPECPDYERRMNWKTGEMHLKGGDEMILHRGSFIPAGLEGNHSTLN